MLRQPRSTLRAFARTNRISAAPNPVVAMDAAAVRPSSADGPPSLPSSGPWRRPPQPARTLNAKATEAR